MGSTKNETKNKNNHVAWSVSTLPLEQTLRKLSIALKIGAVRCSMVGSCLQNLVAHQGRCTTQHEAADHNELPAPRSKALHPRRPTSDIVAHNITMRCCLAHFTFFRAILRQGFGRRTVSLVGCVVRLLARCRCRCRCRSSLGSLSLALSLALSLSLS